MKPAKRWKRVVGKPCLLGLAGFHEASLLDVGVIHSLGKVKSQALQSR